MRVHDLMNHDVCTCRPDQTLEDAARCMWENDVGAVPIVDKRMHPVGILTDRDIAMAAYLSGQRLSERAIDLCMSHEVFTCRPDDSLKFAEAVMAAHQVRRLPVIDASGRLVGMLSINDLARATDGWRRLAAGDFVHALAAISQPRRSPPPQADDGEAARLVDMIY